MDDQTLRRILGDLKALRRDSVRLRFGEVVDDSPFTIELGNAGVATSAARLTSYTPTIGDRVAVLVRGNDLLVLGETV